MMDQARLGRRLFTCGNSSKAISSKRKSTLSTTGSDTRHKFLRNTSFSAVQVRALRTDWPAYRGATWHLKIQPNLHDIHRTWLISFRRRPIWFFIEETKSRFYSTNHFGILFCWEFSLTHQYWRARQRLLAWWSGSIDLLLPITRRRKGRKNEEETKTVRKTIKQTTLV